MLQILRDFPCGAVKGVDNPFVFRCKPVRQAVRHFMPFNIHPDKACSVPDFIGKIAACLHFILGKAHIISRAIPGSKGKAQGICSILANNFQGVNAVSERLRHFTALIVTDKAMEQDGMKRYFPGLFNAGENHPGNPEENNIIARYKRIGWIKILKIRSLVWPSKRGKRPKR